jgi:hypothetical protein
MSDTEVTNLLIFLAGNQRLPAGIRLVDETVDQTEIMANVEIRISEYVRGIPSFAKQLHNKEQARKIYGEILSILETYDFDIKDSFRILWEIAIFGALPISGIPEGKTIESLAKDHIEIVKSKMLNNTLKTYISSEIRTPSKYKNIIKRILNLNGGDFESMFTETGLKKTEQVRRALMDASDAKICESLDGMISHQDFSGNEDEIVSVFYNTVKGLFNHSLRNDYYNSFLRKLVTKMAVFRRVPVKMTNIFVQLYCYLTQHEVIKTVDPKVVEYLATHPVPWFSYQVREMSQKLQPHWNFKSKEFVLDAWQMECLRNIEAKNNILLSAPTSSGKTILSTYAINKYRKIWYIVPSEALAYQLTGIILASLLDRECMVGSVKKNVRLELGSISYKRSGGKDDIIVATPDKMIGLIASKEVDSNQDYIILDEFHNISYEGGHLYEYILKYGGFHKIPVICLSATIPNFDYVYGWLSTILDGTIFGVNEHKRFFNQKRMIVCPTPDGTEMVTVDPLKHMKVETLRSADFTSIGLNPLEVLSLYERLPGVGRMDEATPRFIKLDDVQKLEMDIFTHLKSRKDEDLSGIIADTPIDAQSLSLYQLYVSLRDVDSSMKPMLVFKMDSMKCLEIFTALIEVITDYNELVYGDFNDDQGIVKEFLEEVEKIEGTADVNREKGGSKADAEEKEDAMKQTAFEPFRQRLEDFAAKYLKLREDASGVPLMQPLVDDFNRRYGANLTVEKVYELRREHIKTEREKWVYNEISLRNAYVIHDRARLMTNSISPEQMRKIRHQIGRELERETAINGEFPNMKRLGKQYEKFNTPGGVISYSNPIMLGIEYGLLCYNTLLNPAMTRVSQNLINKFPFITISDKSLAVGINYPIKTVMLLGGLKGEPLEEIDNTLAHQAMGRAGRRGLDTEGIVIYSGVNITNILTPQYRSVVPNDPALISGMFTDESEEFRSFVMTGVRPTVTATAVADEASVGTSNAVDGGPSVSNAVGGGVSELLDGCEDWEEYMAHMDAVEKKTEETAPKKASDGVPESWEDA